MPIPAMIMTVPTGSNFLMVALEKVSLFIVSYGNVKKATMEKTKYKIASHQYDARQLKACVAIPEAIIPKTNPSGLPALKHAKAAFFRFDGFA